MSEPTKHLPEAPDQLPTRRVLGAGLAALKDANTRLLREDVAAGRTVYRGLPEVVTLNHSDICNLRCIMCPRHDRQGTNRLDPATLLHLTNELLPTARKLVLTTAGAEPLAVDYELLMEQAARHLVRVDAVTNGTLLTRDLYRRSRGTLDHLNVSLDCHVREVYEHIRVGGNYERVFGNLRAVCAERHQQRDDVLLSVSAIVMTSNVPHLADFVRFAASLGTIDGVVFQRLRHEERAVPAEEPHDAFSAAELHAAFEAARVAASEGGINLFLSEFGRPPTLARPIRTKIPETLEGKGLCWFLAQNFTVMYTGEVFPCCIPTDYSLGNVLYQDPVDIWNGKPIQKLREAHLSRRGTTFCSGCLHAPHLPAKGSSPLQEPFKRARVTVSETLIKIRERYHARFTPRIFAPRPPPRRLVPASFADRTAATQAQRVQAIGKLTCLDPRDGSLWSLEDMALVRRSAPGDAPTVVAEITGNAAPSCLRVVADAVLLGFEDGCLRRCDAQGITTVLQLSDPRACVRSSGLAASADEVLVGEYGVFPGARCAHLYRSRDGGRSFAHVHHLRAGRHVHAVEAFRDGRFGITTGDIADERRLYVLQRGRPPRLMQRGWSGYTALAEAGDTVHAGTDLVHGNGFVSFRNGLGSAPEFRALPPEHDCQIRQILALGGGELLVLCIADDEGDQRRDRLGAVLRSRDDGRSFEIVHRFAADWRDASDCMVVLAVDPIVLLLPAGTATTLLELPQ